MKPSSFNFTLLFLSVLSLGALPAAEALLGSAEFQPTPERPLGWRGDGSGHYPGAKPPVHYERAANTPLIVTRAQGSKPKGDAPGGSPLVRFGGEFRAQEWLALAPVDAPLPNEATMTPDEGEAVGAAKWKKVSSDGGVDFEKVLGSKPAGKFGYAVTYFYSEENFKCAMSWNGRELKQWLNGKPASGWDRAKQEIKKGWNQITIRVTAPANQDGWAALQCFYPHNEENLSYRETNIRWSRPLPAGSWSTPIIVGDKIYVTSDPSDLICLNKADGKLVWIRSNPVYYAALGAPVAADATDPNYLATMKQSADDLDKLNDELVRTENFAKDEPRKKLSVNMTENVRKNDRTYRVNVGWGGGNTGPTPVTDGKNIFAWFGETGVMACFEPNGKRVWTVFEKPGGGEHGINSSPALAGNVLAVIAGGHFAGFDKTNGKLLWTQKYNHPSYGSAIVTRIGAEYVLVAPDGMVVKASDGEMISPPIGQFDGECASAVIEGNRFYLFARQGFVCVELPAEAKKVNAPKIIREIKPKVLDPEREPYPVGTPVVVDGIYYAVRSGWGAGNRDVIVYAFDPSKPEPLYRQKLNLEPSIYYSPEGGGVCASLAYANGNIYVMDNRGLGIVFKPGPVYTEVARNRLDHWMRGGGKEVTGSTPIFEGKFMYLRGREMLYCIAEP